MYESLMSQRHSGVQKRVLTKGTVLHDCLAHFSGKHVLKEEQRQTVFRLLEKRDIVGVLSTGFGKSLIYNCSRQSNSNKEQKNVVRVPSPLRSFIYD